MLLNHKDQIRGFFFTRILLTRCWSWKIGRLGTVVYDQSRNLVARCAGRQFNNGGFKLHSRMAIVFFLRVPSAPTLVVADAGGARLRRLCHSRKILIGDLQILRMIFRQTILGSLPRRGSTVPKWPDLIFSERGIRRRRCRLFEICRVTYKKIIPENSDPLNVLDRDGLRKIYWGGAR